MCGRQVDFALIILRVSNKLKNQLNWENQKKITEKLNHEKQTD